MFEKVDGRTYDGQTDLPQTHWYLLAYLWALRTDNNIIVALEQRVAIATGGGGYVLLANSSPKILS